MATITDIIIRLFGLVLLVLSVILVNYFIQFLKVKMDNLKICNDQNLQDKYLKLLQETITNCVIATNQTYVSNLKQQGSFTIEAQKEAFQKTYESVLTLLDDETQKYLNEITGDLSKYLTTQIEATVNRTKSINKGD